MEKQLGPILRALRTKKGMDAGEVMKQYDKIRPPSEPGTRINPNKLYSYERGESEPSASNFITLCEIYGCKDILRVFSGVKPDYTILSDEEKTLVDSYRELDQIGREFIDETISHEVSRVSQIRHLRKEEMEEMTILNAAHARSDIETPADVDTTDNDIMDSEDF